MRRCALLCALLILSVAMPASGNASDGRGKPLKIDVVRDRLTLSLTHYPQVYLHGQIDAGAPQRFAALVASGRIEAGSDIYLNARGGERAAGMALGRMFRAGGMATHLGTPRQPKQASIEAKTAVCMDACVYAYLGGLYRWVPSGRDRIGFSSPQMQNTLHSPDGKAYLKAMGIKEDALDGEAWMTAERMIASGVANNGQMPPTATYDLSMPAPKMELRLADRKGTHRLTIQCQPGRTTVTAYDEVGFARARQIALRGGSSYFQLGDEKRLSQPRGGAQAIGNALVIRRDYPPADLVDLISAWSFGAWVGGRSDAFRDGFTMPLQPVRAQLKVFYYTCWRAAPWPPRPKKAR
jgi:hypothetical protein